MDEMILSSDVVRPCWRSQKTSRRKHLPQAPSQSAPLSSLPYLASLAPSPDPSPPRHAHREACVRVGRPPKTPQEMHEMDMMILSSDIVRPRRCSQKTFRRKHPLVVKDPQGWAGEVVHPAR